MRDERTWSGRVVTLAGVGARTGALLLLAFGLLEAIVLFAKRPQSWSLQLFGRVVWSPLLYATAGAAVGALVGLGVALASSRGRGRATGEVLGSAVWALLLSGALAFYWVYAANLLYHGSSRALVALALDVLAVLAGLALAIWLCRRATRGALSVRSRVRWTALLVLLLWLPFYAVAGRPTFQQSRISHPSPEARAARPPSDMNVLLVMLDTVRTDCLSCYGPTEFPTPNIDRLAAESVLFEQAITPEPLTRPTVCSLFTGLHPRTHGVDTNTKPLRPGFVTLAETLREHGYATSAFTAATILSGYFGTAQGFDFYSEPSEPWWHLRSDSAVRRFATSLTSWGAGIQIEIRADEVNSRAMRWMSRDRDRPFFAFVHYFDPHAPYDPPGRYDLAAREGLAHVPVPYADEQIRFSPDFEMPPDYLRQQWLRYVGEIGYVDEHFGRLLDFLADRGDDRRTIVILVADHGESFEHNAYFSHGTRLYDPQTRVALMIRDPRLPGPRRLSGQVRLIDLYPTILSLVGLEPPAPVQGVDLAPRLAGAERAFAHLPSFCQTDLEDRRPLSSRASHGLRLPPWKYIESPEIGLVELYHLRDDPGETANVATEAPEVCERMAGALADWLARTDRLETEPVPTTPELSEALRALGYVH